VTVQPPGQPEQLQLEQPLTSPFADLGTSRCEYVSPRWGSRCSNSGSWDGLSGRVLCDEHANEAA
jgi:hypothetical protein